MTTQLAKQAPVKNDAVVTIDKYLQKAKDAIAQRLGEHFGPDEMIALVHTSLRRTRHLAECDPLTIVGCVYEAAQVGLRPDATLGHCYLVPYRNGKRSEREGRDVYECQLIIGYRGMLVLAHQGGTLTSLSTNVVYERDVFAYSDGSEFRVHHEPYNKRDRGQPIAVYAALRLAGGGVQGKVLPWWMIEDLKKKAASRGDSPWRTYEGPMAEKTALRRGLKGVPMSPKVERVMQLDGRAEAGVSQGTRASAAQLLGEDFAADFDDEDGSDDGEGQALPDAGKQMQALLDATASEPVDPTDKDAP